MDTKRILITGATGFVGQACAKALYETGRYEIRLAVRHLNRLKHKLPPVETIEVHSLSAETAWEKALQGCEYVVHIAGRAHVLKEKKPAHAIQAFKQINVDGTIRLAKQAVLAGVKRFIFISTIKVNGERTLENKPFHAEDKPAPLDPYAQSKLEAEKALKALASETGLEVVIIRPPLIYGPGVKGNLSIMLRWIKRGWPVFFIKTPVKRSLIALRNLNDFIDVCITHPNAAQQTFLVSDGHDLTVQALMQMIGELLGKPAHFIYLPLQWLTLLLTMIGKRSAVDKLYAPLQVDIEKNKALLGWTPPFDVPTMLAEMVRNYKQTD